MLIFSSTPGISFNLRLPHLQGRSQWNLTPPTKARKLKSNDSRRWNLRKSCSHISQSSQFGGGSQESSEGILSKPQPAHGSAFSSEPSSFAPKTSHVGIIRSYANPCQYSGWKGQCIFVLAGFGSLREGFLAYFEHESRGEDPLRGWIPP